MSNRTRFFLDSDDDGVWWYVIPVAYRKEWDAWAWLPETCGPKFATRIDGDLSLVEFESPIWPGSGVPK